MRLKFINWDASFEELGLKLPAANLEEVDVLSHDAVAGAIGQGRIISFIAEHKYGGYNFKFLVEYP